MEEKVNTAEQRKEGGFWKSVVVALVFALFFDIFAYNVLFQGMPLGINVPLLTAGFYAAIFISQGKRCSLARQGNWLLLVFIAAASVTFVFFNNATLLFWNGIAIVIMAGIQISLMTGHFVEKPYTVAYIQDVCHMVFVRPFHKIGAVFTGIFSGKREKSRRTLGVLLGIAIAIPIFALIAALLCWADPVFSKLFGDLFSWENLWTAIGWIVVGIVVAILAASGLVSLHTAQITRTPHTPKTPAKFNLTAVYVILAAVNALLLAFAVVQILAMSGSVALPDGMTYSEYARSGFYQMCAVAVIDFALVALCSRYTWQAKGGAATGLKALNTLLSFSTCLMLISAFARMVLYEQAYQFTRMRLYVQAFIILLAIVLILLVIRVWKKAFPILKATFLATVICLIGLTYFNTDAFIAKNNVQHLDKTVQIAQQEDRRFHLLPGSPKDQIEYLLSLSVDALPYYWDYLDQSDFTDKEMDEIDGYRESVLYRRTQLLAQRIEEAEAGGGDIRGYNAGRWAARESLSEKPALTELIKNAKEEPLRLW